MKTIGISARERGFFKAVGSRLLGWRRDGRVPVGGVRFGDLRRLTPISRHFGYDRGLPVDRYYVEGFLASHAPDIRGRVLEVGDNTYTRRFGGTGVRQSDVLHVTAGHPDATIVADLASAPHIPAEQFDCIILTQTLHLIYDVRAAMRTIWRILKPGGVLLATVPGISQVDRGAWGHSWYWSFTGQALRLLVDEAFPSSDVHIATYGNVLAACAFLHGLATAELSREELDHTDPHYQVVITLRAVKPGAQDAG
jgi:SAM-dependent methyltransferase